MSKWKMSKWKKHKKALEVLTFVAGGATSGAGLSATVGGMGLAVGGTAISIGTGAVTAAGTVVGLAAYGLKKAIKG